VADVIRGIRPGSLPGWLSWFQWPDRIHKEVLLLRSSTGAEWAVIPAEQALRFSPDGNLLATWGEKQGLQIWDVPPVKPYGPIVGWSVLVGVITLLAGVLVNRRGRPHFSGGSSGGEEPRRP
jgi:hypothetical protein